MKATKQNQILLMILWICRSKMFKSICIFTILIIYHRFIMYDQERMMYRKLNGELLDTREKHLEYYNLLR